MAAEIVLDVKLSGSDLDMTAFDAGMIPISRVVKCRNETVLRWNSSAVRCSGLLVRRKMVRMMYHCMTVAQNRTCWACRANSGRPI